MKIRQKSERVRVSMWYQRPRLFILNNGPKQGLTLGKCCKYLTICYCTRLGNSSTHEDEERSFVLDFSYWDIFDEPKIVPDQTSQEYAKTLCNQTRKEKQRPRGNKKGVQSKKRIRNKRKNEELIKVKTADRNHEQESWVFRHANMLIKGLTSVNWVKVVGYFVVAFVSIRSESSKPSLVGSLNLMNTAGYAQESPSVRQVPTRNYEPVWEDPDSTNDSTRSREMGVFIRPERMGVNWYRQTGQVVADVPGVALQRFPIYKNNRSVTWGTNPVALKQMDAMSNGVAHWSQVLLENLTIVLYRDWTCVTNHVFHVDRPPESDMFTMEVQLHSVVPHLSMEFEWPRLKMKAVVDVRDKFLIRNHRWDDNEIPPLTTVLTGQGSEDTGRKVEITFHTQSRTWLDHLYVKVGGDYRINPALPFEKGYAGIGVEFGNGRKPRVSKEPSRPPVRNGSTLNTKTNEKGPKSATNVKDEAHGEELKQRVFKAITNDPDILKKFTQMFLLLRGLYGISRFISSFDARN